MQRLTKTFATTDCTSLDDALACMMATIEDGLLTSGFVPGQDYQRKDLFIAAMPIIQAMFSKGKMAYTIGWPNARVQPAAKAQLLTVGCNDVLCVIWMIYGISIH